MSVAAATNAMITPDEDRVVSIESADAQNETEWRAYVDEATHASLFHHWAWGRVIREVYGYETLRLVARRDGKITGICPLVDVKSPIFGRSLISTAFTVGGGILADDEFTAEQLAAVAIELGEARNVQYVELRSETALLKDWRTKDSVYAGFRKAMPEGVEERLTSIPRKRRAEVRKALKLAEEGRLSIRFDNDIATFHKIYAQSLRDLGTPVFSKKFAEILMDEFGESAEIAIVEGDGEPVAALLSFYFRDRVMPYYVGAVGNARALRAFDYLYWSLMKRAAERGAHVFDFGRSKIGTPHFDYKKLWGFEPEPLAYQYALVKAADVPNVNPNNPKFRMVSETWKRLPLPLANAVGPLLARHLA